MWFNFLCPILKYSLMVTGSSLRAETSNFNCGRGGRKERFSDIELRIVSLKYQHLALSWLGDCHIEQLNNILSMKELSGYYGWFYFLLGVNFSVTIPISVTCVTWSVSSVTQLCSTLCNPMDLSMPGLPVHHQLLELAQLMSIESVMPSNQLIFCHPRLLLLSIFPRSGSFLMSQFFHQVDKILELQL